MAGGFLCRELPADPATERRAAKYVALLRRAEAAGFATVDEWIDGLEESLSELTLKEAPSVTIADLESVRDQSMRVEKRITDLISNLEGSIEALRNPPEEDAEEESEDEAEEEAETDEEAIESEPAAEEAAPAAAPVVTGDGTALVINLMIGIGNKPFVRGSGPGLSADHGIPMNFLGIGRWQWVCPQPDAPATVEVWKNDQSPLGEPIHLSGGETVELDESHFSGA